ncbi:MAG: hypothetical protein QG622_677 [Actinomycetota bacterium]|nr:hypothetical protein [Actinomycetota bacterium]
MSDGERTAPVRLAIVDDDPLVRRVLSFMLGGCEDIEIVAEASDGDEVAAMVDAHAPDVVLMDLRMSRMDGLTATELLMKRPGPPQVIVLTTFDTDEYVLRALQAGAAGFLLKDTPPPQMLEAVRRVAAGEATLSPAVLRRLITRVTMTGSGANRRQKEARQRLQQLTARELEVARAVGRGLTNAELAGELFMSVATVKAHVSRLLAKLDLENRVQVALLVHDADLD